MHRESLLNIPLVRQLVSDPSIILRPRAVDERWYDFKHIPGSALGFRPFYGELFYADGGRVAGWLEHLDQSARGLNTRDLLVGDVLFLLHDYLHAWAYSYLRHELGVPDLGYGEPSESSLERYTFLHLLTEACATVGLDYWWLSTIRLDDLVPIGTMHGPLTVSYLERKLSEYQRGYPELSVQRTEFFTTLATFYCTGEFHGFDASDLANSPALYLWLEHELSYGRNQRSYFRQWLRFLAGLPQVTFKEGSRPVGCAEPWQRELMDALGRALWQKVKEDIRHELPAPTNGPWASAETARPDFRFINVSILDPDELAELADQPRSEAGFDAFFSQYVSMFKFDSMSEERREHLLPLVRSSRNMKATLALMEGAEKLPQPPQPRDMLFLG